MPFAVYTSNYTSKNKLFNAERCKLSSDQMVQTLGCVNTVPTVPMFQG